MGKYKHGKPDQLIDLVYFSERLKKGKYWLRRLAYQSYAVLLFYVGCRRSEPLAPVKRTRRVWQLYIPETHGDLDQYSRKESRGKRRQWYVLRSLIYTPLTGVRKKDVWVKNKSLFVKVPALKGGVKDKANELFLDWAFVDLILKQAEAVKNEEGYLWPFSPETAYNVVRFNFPKKTPHWFRHSRVTTLRALRDKGLITTDDIKAVTGIQSDATIEGYGMKTQEGVHKVAEAISQTLN